MTDVILFSFLQHDHKNFRSDNFILLLEHSNTTSSFHEPFLNSTTRYFIGFCIIITKKFTSFNAKITFVAFCLYYCYSVCKRIMVYLFLFKQK